MQFTYNSAAVHLLGVLTEQFLDRSLIDYAGQELFTPIGIVQREWEMLSSGFPNGGAASPRSRAANRVWHARR